MECVISIRLFLIGVRSAAVLGVLGCAASPACAQDAPEAAAIERTIPLQIDEQSSLLPIPLLPRELAMPHGTTGRFTLGAVNIDGATAFSAAELSKDFEPFLASEIDGRKLGEIAARITSRYRNSGFVLSYALVPSQRVESGIVRFSVVEGRIGSVQIVGADADKAAVEAIVAPVTRETPLRSDTLERALGLIRDYPGIDVTDVRLTRSDNDRGLYGLKITAKRNRFRSLAYIDNRGSRSIGRLRYYSNVSFSSAVIQGDELRLDAFAMPGRHFHYLYGQLSASVPIGGDGLRFGLAASKGDQFLHDTDPLNSDSRNLSAQLSFPFLRARNLTMVGKVSLNDWRSAAAEHHVPTLRDRFRVARLGVEFSRESKSRIRGELTLSRGLGFDGMTRRGDPLASRSDASGRFTKAAFAIQLTRPLSDTVRLQAAAAGQYSDRPLLSVEEFALGGSRIGRAFAFNTLTGGRGIGGALEIDYRLSKSKSADPWLFGFVDGGSVFDTEKAAGPRKTRSLASAGAGVRFKLAGATFSVEAGVPIAVQGAHKPVRLFFSTYRAF